MKVSYKFPRLGLDGDVDGPSVCMSDQHGSFLFLSVPVVSKFNGFFAAFDLDVFKVLEDVRLKEGPVTAIESHLDFVKLKYPSADMKLQCGRKGLVCSLSKKSTIVLDFDFKKGYDSRSFGRYHDVSVDKKDLIIRFTKKTDEKEDSFHGAQEFELFCIIRPNSSDLSKDMHRIDLWKHSHYRYDESRNDGPFERYVFCPFELSCKGFVLSVGRTLAEARKNLAAVSKTSPPKLNLVKGDKPIGLAFACAQRSLQNLMCDGRLFAGYPWFYQFWARDESISTIGLSLIGKEKLSKDILMGYIDMVGPDGRIPNRLPASSLGCADGVGWVFKRLRDLFLAKGSLFTVTDRKHIITQLKKAVTRIIDNHMVDGLVRNAPLETWMDTRWQHMDGREGFCIEIQAQFLNMLRFLHELTDEKIFKTRLDAMAEHVRQQFFNGQFLADMVDDTTVRPNIFIAYYSYPELLTAEEWRIVFENSLPRLWLDWGGLSSIDKSHHLFTPDYTGATNRSYHRGDSWYWINNLAATCLHRVDKVFFKDRIDAIVKASTQEILWSGSLGDHAEVSDASHLASKGCLSQAWSAATFIELALELSSMK